MTRSLDNEADHGDGVKGHVRDDARNESLAAAQDQCEHHAKKGETHELQRLAGAGLFLAFERASQRDAHDEPLRAVGQVVQVDDRHLLAVGVDRVAAAARLLTPDFCLRFSSQTLAGLMSRWIRPWS